MNVTRSELYARRVPSRHRSRIAVSTLLLAFTAFGQTSGPSTAATNALPPSQDDSSRADVTWWGYADTRSWRDVNHDGFKDFCRVIRTPQKGFALRCTLATGNGVEQQYAGASFEMEISQTGTLTTGRWTTMSRDSSSWFCRTIPAGVSRGYLSCIPVLPLEFGKEVRTAVPVELGIPSGRAWVDFDGDGKPDFCTLIEQRPGLGKLACRLSTGQTFAQVAITSEKMSWKPASMRQWIVNGEGKVDFCTVAGPGNRFVDCISSTGQSFGEIHRDLLDHRTSR